MALHTISGDRFHRPWPRTDSVARGRLRRGYTLIEIIIVMAIISILVSVAVPVYQKTVLRSRESVLRNNLFSMRQVIDEFTYDKKKAPKSLDELVSGGYLRKIPVDPITGSNRSWRVVQEDAVTSVDQTEPGIGDVQSGSDKVSLEGTKYSEW